MAKEPWRQFEKRIIHDVRLSGNVITRIPSSLDRAAGGRIFRAKTDCDFAGAVEGTPFFFDAKACGEKQFNLNSLVLRDTKIHQYNFLLDAYSKVCDAGYLIWFYKQGSFVWLPVTYVKSVGPSVVPGCPLTRMQPDDKPINLKFLFWGK